MGWRKPPTIYLYYGCQQNSCFFAQQKSWGHLKSLQLQRNIFKKSMSTSSQLPTVFPHTPKAVHGPVALRCLEAPKQPVERKVDVFSILQLDLGTLKDCVFCCWQFSVFLKKHLTKLEYPEKRERCVFLCILWFCDFYIFLWLGEACSNWGAFDFFKDALKRTYLKVFVGIRK